MVRVVREKYQMLWEESRNSILLLFEGTKNSINVYEVVFFGVNVYIENISAIKSIAPKYSKNLAVNWNLNSISIGFYYDQPILATIQPNWLRKEDQATTKLQSQN